MSRDTETISNTNNISSMPKARPTGSRKVAGSGIIVPSTKKTRKRNLSKLSLENRLEPYLRKITNQERIDFKIEKLMGDASSREYFRIHLKNHAQFKSLVLMKFMPENAFSSDEASFGGTLETLPFIDVLKYLEAGNLPVPKIYLADVKNGFIFLEDLGDLQMFLLVNKAESDIKYKWYAKAIDLLVDFQSYTSKKPNENCIAFKRNFDLVLLIWECEHYLEYGIEVLYDIKIDEPDREAFARLFETICKQLVALPQIVVHRDFQSKNLMVHNDKLTLIDFQDALIGSQVYDLVALLRDSYVVLDESLVDRLIDYYIDSYQNKIGVLIHKENFKRAFLLQTVQRKLKDSGRFVFIDRIKHNPSFMQYIPDSLGYVSQALRRLPDLAELSTLLFKYEERLKP